MRLLLLAGPGAGKGTQARFLARHYGVEHLASGELLRAEVEARSEIGRAVEASINDGDLVPDDVILTVIGQRLSTAAENGGYILDGFPRNLAQAKRAYQMALDIGGIELQAVIHLDVGRAELRRRMLGRARNEGRSDDTDRAIDHRLDVFDEQTEPLIGYYRSRGLLTTVDGNQAVEAVTAAIEKALVGVVEPETAR